MHQFCEGSHSVPAFRCRNQERRLKDWSVVFTGHHHQYEDLGYAVTPGSLEIHVAKELGKKGFVLYDTDTKRHEFVVLPPSRNIRYTEMNGEGKSPKDSKRPLKYGFAVILSRRPFSHSNRWNSIIRQVCWDRMATSSFNRQPVGCLKVHFEGGLQDQVRTAPEIRATVNFQDFIKKRFASRQKNRLSSMSMNFAKKEMRFQTQSWMESSKRREVRRNETLEVKLHNFRSYGTADIEFSDSQNYVFGKNWQGKSSLMDGVAYALFGKQAFPTRLAGTAVKAETPRPRRFRRRFGWAWILNIMVIITVWKERALVTNLP